MYKICTDIKQAKKLIELGIDVNSADMYYMYRHWEIDEETIGIQSDASIGFDSDFYCGTDNGKTYHYIPAWSLSALIELMPPYLFEFERGIDLNVYPNLNGKGWHCSYMPNAVENMKNDKFKQITNGDNPIDAAFEMICWLLENKKI